MFRLIGTKSNRSAIGARVTVHSGNVNQLAEVRSGSSYCSQNDLRLHFGLGAATSMTSIEIAWPSGKKDTYKDLPADLIYTINEDNGIIAKVPFATPAGQSKADPPAKPPTSPR